MRKETFENGAYYHICNRGVDGRNIVTSARDADRFVQCLDVFNDVELTGSLYLLSFKVDKPKRKKKLVDIIAYCINPNHFHLVVCQLVDNGISKFIKRLAGGYSWYFNKKHGRKGALFQGPFKAKLVDENNYLLHVTTYVNLNNKVHGLSDQVASFVRSSWPQYQGLATGFCNPKIILSQFGNHKEYVTYANETLPDMKAKRADYSELKDLLLGD